MEIKDKEFIEKFFMEIKDKEFIEKSFKDLINIVEDLMNAIENIIKQGDSLNFRLITLEKIIESKIKNGEINGT